MEKQSGGESISPHEIQGTEVWIHFSKAALSKKGKGLGRTSANMTVLGARDPKLNVEDEIQNKLSELRNLYFFIKGILATLVNAMIALIRGTTALHLNSCAIYLYDYRLQ